MASRREARISASGPKRCASRAPTRSSAPRRSPPSCASTRRASSPTTPGCASRAHAAKASGPAARQLEWGEQHPKAIRATARVSTSRSSSARGEPAGRAPPPQDRIPKPRPTERREAQRCSRELAAGERPRDQLRWAAIRQRPRPGCEAPRHAERRRSVVARPETLDESLGARAGPVAASVRLAQSEAPLAEAIARRGARAPAARACRWRPTLRRPGAPETRLAQKRAPRALAASRAESGRARRETLRIDGVARRAARVASALRLRGELGRRRCKHLLAAGAFGRRASRAGGTRVVIATRAASGRGDRGGRAGAEPGCSRHRPLLPDEAEARRRGRKRRAVIALSRREGLGRGRRSCARRDSPRLERTAGGVRDNGAGLRRFAILVSGRSIGRRAARGVWARSRRGGGGGGRTTGRATTRRAIVA